MMITVDLTTLPTWHVERADGWGWQVYEIVGKRQRGILITESEEIARMVAAMPAVFKFFSKFRPEAPIAIPLQTMLASQNIALASLSGIKIKESAE